MVCVDYRLNQKASVPEKLRRRIGEIERAAAER
jgi:hypothetical protein